VRKIRQGTKHTEPCLDVGTLCSTSEVNICFRQNQSQHKNIQQTAVKRIFRYLKGTTNLGLLYRKSLDYNLVGFCDADYAGDKIERKSTSGNCQFLGENLISWAKNFSSSRKLLKEYLYTIKFILNFDGTSTLYFEGRTFSKGHYTCIGIKVLRTLLFAKGQK